MSDTMDPAKMKMAELRIKLSVRGLDTKGAKAALVKRLKDALETETVEIIPETSTEDMNMLQDNFQASEEVVSPRMENVQQVAESVSQEDAPNESQEQGDVLDDGNDQVEKEDDAKIGERRRGVKRQRSPSPSPRSPELVIKEDEPELDSNAVQLSWYDSDLNLQIDKETFLSARPLCAEGFGFLWAGVRSSHGVSSGKVWYEVKITEECQWEPPERPERQTQNFVLNSDANLNKGEQSRDKARTEEAKADDAKVKNEVEEVEVEESANVETQDKLANENKGEADVEIKTEVGDERDEEIIVIVEDADDKPVNGENKNTEEENKEEAKENEKPKKPELTRLLRIGWSTVDTTLQLGEQKYSYGYDSTGLSVTDSVFTKSGKKLTNGDVIASFLDLESDPITITYAVNGEVLPTAFIIPQSELPKDFVLFPHILTRNYAFEVNFGQKEEPWFDPPEDFRDYSYVKDAESKIAGPARPDKREDCEIIMMCGLPASGKTRWVNEWVKNNPEKRYTLFSLAHVMKRMKVQGKTLHKNICRRYWKSQNYMCTRFIYKLLELASQRRRNYILDQTNVFPAAQRRKLRPFQGFQRRAVIVVVSDEEQNAREARKHLSGSKDVPNWVILQMKGSMALPTTCEWLEEVTYAELDESEAKKLVEKYNKEGRDAGYEPRFNDNKRSRIDNCCDNKNSGPGYIGNQEPPPQNVINPPYRNQGCASGCQQQGDWEGNQGDKFSANWGPPPQNGINHLYQGWSSSGGQIQQRGSEGGEGGNQIGTAEPFLLDLQVAPVLPMYYFETLMLAVPKPFVYHVKLNRPQQLNAINGPMWIEIEKCFERLSKDKDCRVVVLSAAGRIFTAGLDFEFELEQQTAEIAQYSNTACKAKVLKDSSEKFQRSVSSLEVCKKPVIAAVHEGCIGGGVDLVTAADIRYCSRDAWFQLKEVDIGLAAGVGAMQRLSKVVGSDSLVREICYTARKVNADEALKVGLVSKVFEDRDSLINGAIALAEKIATKSPVAVQGTKKSLGEDFVKLLDLLKK